VVVAFAACGVGSLGGEVTAVDAVLDVPEGALDSFVSLTLEQIPACAYPISLSLQQSQTETCSGDAAGFGTVAGKVDFVGSPGVVSINPYALNPSDVSFAAPATLELSTKDMLLSSTAVVPDPTRLDRLRIGTVVNGRWVAVSGSVFDAQAQVVRGQVTAGGRYAITQICADGTIGSCP
jgi:hypothetical protein